eukprot:TRINITY_DN1869_c0_g1_i1.p1 TRINITY_DN1869_c0_g1~~TRINITY_DN1869_c0_g1_i1.p1  ORF type:complete len:705 (+),score=155.69 TRINITY_DN1869_c0_g1_i1:112-2226(+)
MMFWVYHPNIMDLLFLQYGKEALNKKMLDVVRKRKHRDHVETHKYIFHIKVNDVLGVPSKYNGSAIFAVWKRGKENGQTQVVAVNGGRANINFEITFDIRLMYNTSKKEYHPKGLSINIKQDLSKGSKSLGKVDIDLSNMVHIVNKLYTFPLKKKNQNPKIQIEFSSELVRAGGQKIIRKVDSKINDKRLVNGHLRQFGGNVFLTRTTTNFSAMDVETDVGSDEEFVIPLEKQANNDNYMEQVQIYEEIYSQKETIINSLKEDIQVYDEEVKSMKKEIRELKKLNMRKNKQYQASNGELHEAVDIDELEKLKKKNKSMRKKNKNGAEDIENYQNDISNLSNEKKKLKKILRKADSVTIQVTTPSEEQISNELIIKLDELETKNEINTFVFNCIYGSDYTFNNQYKSVTSEVIFTRVSENHGLETGDNFLYNTITDSITNILMMGSKIEPNINYFWLSTLTSLDNYISIIEPLSSEAEIFLEEIEYMTDQLFINILKDVVDSISEKTKEVFLIPNSGSSPSSIIRRLSNIVKSMKKFHIPSFLASSILTSIVQFISYTIFNEMISIEEYCSVDIGIHMKTGASEVRDYIEKIGKVLDMRKALSYLEILNEICQVLILDKSIFLDEGLVDAICPNINIRQIHRLVLNFQPDKDSQVPGEVLQELKRKSEAINEKLILRTDIEKKQKIQVRDLINENFDKAIEWTVE